jgi:hypothetical protein
MVEPMHAASVNGWVYIPLPFVIMIYCTVLTIAIVGTAYLVRKKNPLLQALRKSVVIAFFCSGFLYLVYSERTWYKWFSHDIETYSGHSTEEKTTKDFGSLYDFALTAQKVLQDNEYSLYCDNRSSSLIIQYYLLPRRNRANAKNILVFYDTDAAYDDGTKTFIRGDMRIGNAEMLFRYDSGAYILRTR